MYKRTIKEAIIKEFKELSMCYNVKCYIDSYDKEITVTIVISGGKLTEKYNVSACFNKVEMDFYRHDMVNNFVREMKSRLEREICLVKFEFSDR